MKKKSAIVFGANMYEYNIPEGQYLHAIKDKSKLFDTAKNIFFYIQYKKERKKSQKQKPVRKI